MILKLSCAFLFGFVALIIGACSDTEPDALTAVPLTDGMIRLGELQKSEGVTDGIAFIERIPVWNCNNSESVLVNVRLEFRKRHFCDAARLRQSKIALFSFQPHSDQYTTIQKDGQIYLLKPRLLISR